MQGGRSFAERFLHSLLGLGTPADALVPAKVGVLTPQLPLQAEGSGLREKPASRSRSQGFPGTSHLQRNSDGPGLAGLR